MNTATNSLTCSDKWDITNKEKASARINARMLFEFLLLVFDSDCAVFVNGDGHAVLDIVEEPSPRQSTVGIGSSVQTAERIAPAAASESICSEKSRQAGVLPMTFAQ